MSERGERDADSGSRDEDGRDEARAAILKRRARFVTVALASAGIMASAEGCEPQTCLSPPLPPPAADAGPSASPPQVCLAPLPPPEPVDAGTDAAPTAVDASTDAGTDAGADAAAPPPAPPPPRVCLKRRPPPRPCLNMAKPPKGPLEGALWHDADDTKSS